MRNRLAGYFRALEDGKLAKYHDHREYFKEKSTWFKRGFLSQWIAMYRSPSLTEYVIARIITIVIFVTILYALAIGR